MKKFVMRNDRVREHLIDYLDSIDIDEDKPFEVSIKNHKKSMSDTQRALYWVYLRLISQHSGSSVNDHHVYYRSEFLGYEVSKIMGEDISELKSTTSLSAKAFSEYLEKIETHAIEFFGVSLPQPEDL